MNTLFTLSNIGLVIDIIGAMLMFFGAEKVLYTVIVHKNEKYQSLAKKATRKNRMVKIGAVLLLIGFILQLVGNNS